MKLIVLGGILYLYYHFFYRKSALNAGDEQPEINSADDHDADYVDYEEVD